MAVVNTNRKQEKPVSPYTGLEGVSTNTAQRFGQAQQGYKPSEAVNTAQQAWNEIQAQKPATYQSKYSGALDNILNQIQNPKDFKYEFNGDNLFRSYADLYNQYAKQGMMDAMGNAAALTGGYGNSYAKAVGQQQYQQNMLPLYEKGMELYDRAYQRYQDDQNNLMNQYSILNNAENTDYSRFRDEMGDWMTQEQLGYNRYMDAQSFDYNAYRDDLNFWAGLAQVENADYRNEQERQEAIRQYEQNYAENVRQYNENMAEQKRQYDQNYAENVRQYNESLAEQKRQFDLDMAYKQDEFKYKWGLAGGGGGDGGSSSPGSYNPGSQQQDQYYAMNGNIYTLDDAGKYNLADTSKLTKDTVIDKSIETQLDHRRRNLGR